MSSDNSKCPHCCQIRCEWQGLESSITDVAEQWLLDDYGFDSDGPPPNVVHKYYYRAYILIKHGALGASQRITIPDCILKGVRTLYPES